MAEGRRSEALGEGESGDDGVGRNGWGCDALGDGQVDKQSG